MKDTKEPELVSMNRVVAMTSLSRTSINRYRGERRFPEPVSLGSRRIAFRKAEIQDWINGRPPARPIGAAAS